MRLYQRCVAQGWPEWQRWSASTREQVLRSIVVFINGLTASAVITRSDWPAERLIAQLDLQLGLLRAWARRGGK
jgi:hypothetical protein